MRLGCFRLTKPSLRCLKVICGIPLVILAVWFVVLPIVLLYAVTLGAVDATECIDRVLDKAAMGTL